MAEEINDDFLESENFMKEGNETNMLGEDSNDFENLSENLQDLEKPNQNKAFEEDFLNEAKAVIQTQDSSAMSQKINFSDEITRDNYDTLNNIEVELTMEVGRAQMKLSDILLLGQGSIIELNKLVGSDMDITINNKKVAVGSIVRNRERFGTKITRILSEKERIKIITRGMAKNSQ